MKLILKADVDNLGSLGDEVIVKAGFARNYLVPKNLAVPVTTANLKQIKHQKALLAKKRADAIENAKSLADRLNAVSLTFTVKAGESGKLFGSVTAKNILEKLDEAGISIDRKLLVFSSSLKTLGSFEIPVKLHSEVKTSIKIKLIAEKTETPEGGASETKPEATESETAEETH